MRPKHRHHHHPGEPPRHHPEPPHGGHPGEPPRHHPEPPHREEPREGDYPGGRMNRFLQPRLLLLLAQKTESYGYELIEGVGRLGFEEGGIDPGAVYKSLRAMERDGLVVSEWNTEGTGPAKRIYRLTPEGDEMLHSWMASIRGRKAALEQLLSDYDAYLNTQTAAPNSPSE